MHPAAPPLPEPLRSDCDHDWPPMWRTRPGSRHRCGYGSCRVLRVNDNDVLTYYAPDGTTIGWEPVPDYMLTWRGWWAPLLSGDDSALPGPDEVDPDAIMRELHDYSMVMAEVTKVYGELTGDQITKPNAAAHHVLDAAAARENEHVVDVLDRLADELEAAGHPAAARAVRNMREDYGGDPDLTIPSSGVAYRVLSAGPFRVFFTDDPGWTPDGQLFCDDTLVIISGTSPVQVVCRAADLPGGGEDPQRRDQALQLLGQLCRDQGWCADLGAGVITIISDQDADAAAATVAAALQAAGLGPVTLHDDDAHDADDADGNDGIHITSGTWPVQIHVPAGEAAAAALAARLAEQEGWRAEQAEPGWLAVIPALSQ
jgi:hypothetical protein